MRSTPISDGIGGAISFVAAVAHPENNRRHDLLVKAAVKLARAAEGLRAPPVAQRIQKKNALATVNEGLATISRYRFRAVWLALRQMDGDRAMESYRKLIDLFPPEPPWGDDFTVQKNVWRPSLPALAMAFPLAWLAYVERRELLGLLYSDDWVGWAFDSARGVAPALAERFPRANLLVPCKPWSDPRKPFFSGLRSG